jgi:hypothetical protein
MLKINNTEIGMTCYYRRDEHEVLDIKNHKLSEVVSCIISSPSDLLMLYSEVFFYGVCPNVFSRYNSMKCSYTFKRIS